MPTEPQLCELLPRRHDTKIPATKSGPPSAPISSATHVLSATRRSGCTRESSGRTCWYFDAGAGRVLISAVADDADLTVVLGSVRPERQGKIATLVIRAPVPDGSIVGLFRERLANVRGWYDEESGYSCGLVDLVARLR